MTSTRPSTVNPQQQKDSGASNQLLPEEVGTSSLISTQQVPIGQPVARRRRPKKSTQIAEKLANKVTTSNSKGKKREAENQEVGPATASSSTSNPQQNLTDTTRPKKKQKNSSASISQLPSENLTSTRQILIAQPVSKRGRSKKTAQITEESTN